MGIKYRSSHDVILTLLEPFMSANRTPPAVRLLHFERCMCISLAYTAFQEADGVGFVESHGRMLPPHSLGQLLGRGALSGPGRLS